MIPGTSSLKFGKRGLKELPEIASDEGVRRRRFTIALLGESSCSVL